MDVLYLHGYNVVSTRHFRFLPRRLKGLRPPVQKVFISKYVTLDDALTMPDLVKAFDAALHGLFGRPWGRKKFACVAHSTGGVLIRHWIQTYYGTSNKPLPLSHLVLLSPPNNGSRLATVSKSIMSRFRSRLGVERGEKMLEELQLGSRFLWDLNSAWLERRWHRRPGFYPVVVAGQWIDPAQIDPLVPASSEPGSDGYVRAASSNLNMRKFVLQADGGVRKESIDGVPYLLTPRTAHSDPPYGIVEGIPKMGPHPVLEAIHQALSVKNDHDYEALRKDFSLRSATLQSEETLYDGSPLDRYCQLVFRIVDDEGNALNDYAIELLDPERMSFRMPAGLLAHEHKNRANPELFVFYLNYDRLKKIKGGRLGVRVHVASASSLVSYEDFLYLGAGQKNSEFIKPNQTTLVEIVLRRRLNKNLFVLTSDLSPQKIQRRPSDIWI
ncbi:MAG: hypothetical protein LHV69_08290 [Elusimicrobia bacterium]|nr:hypothetical protein [Candidatus Obscuribacterium magneticum]